MTKISHISWGVMTKGVTTKAFTVIKWGRWDRSVPDEAINLQKKAYQEYL